MSWGLPPAKQGIAAKNNRQERQSIVHHYRVLAPREAHAALTKGSKLRLGQMRHAVEAEQHGVAVAQPHGGDG
jgi:hypothetical protein